MLSDSTSELRRLFEEFDADGSGSISVEEMEQITQRMNTSMSRKEIEVLLLEFDEDNSGVIEFNEFVQMVQRAKCGGIADIINSLKQSYLDESALAAGAGDCEWYTDEMLIKRERLKHDPLVTATLQRSWDTCSQGGAVSKDGYLEMIRKIYLVLKARVPRRPAPRSPISIARRVRSATSRHALLCAGGGVQLLAGRLPRE